MAKEKKKQNWKIPVIVGVICLIAVITFIAFALQQNSSNSSSNSGASSQNQQRQKTCIDIQVPYEAQEEYTEQEPYESVECHQEALKYSQEVTDCRNSLLVLGNARTACLVTNLDSEYGVFDVTINLKCADGQWFKASTKLSIPPYSSDTFKNADLSFCQRATCSCEVNPPTKQVCNNVIKYRDAIRYRTITKYRTEQKCE